MKTFFSTFLAILIFISSCTSHADKNSKKFTLQGEIKGQDSGKIVISYMPEETRIYDTTIIKNGKFIFSGKIIEPTPAILISGNGRAFIYLEPHMMKIFLIKDKFEECKMIGSKTQDDFDLLNNLKKPFHERISIIRRQYQSINDSITNSSNDSYKILLEKRAEELDRLWTQEGKKIDSIGIKFVLDNPKSFAAVRELSMLNNNEKLSLDSVKSIFSGLDKSLKKSIYGKIIIDVVRKKENILIGAQAPDFKATDLKQQTVTLTQFKGGSAVLLDFWASWCVPCRESIPHLKLIYNKYHSKGFEVIAISDDDDRKSWTNAVKQDSTGMWYHILVAEKWPCGPSQLTNDDVQQNYFYTAIPQQILIDKSGKIIYRHVGHSEESEKALENKMSQIFDN